MSATLALDTSVAIPLLMQTHESHAAVVRWWDQREVSLCGHALAETYSVLTRLPGDLRLTPSDAATLLRQRFSTPFVLSTAGARRVVDDLSRIGVAGGAVYDALIALAAIQHGVELATRDARARDTYEKVGATVVVVT